MQPRTPDAEGDEVPAEAGLSGRRTRKRRLLRGVLVAAVLVVALGVGFIWYSNTSTLTFVWDEPPGAVEPGETITIEPVEGKCNPNSSIFYRPGWFGRWQQTHVEQERDMIDWWSIESRSYFEILPCASGAFTVQVPADVTWPTVAVCDMSKRCVKVRVDLSGTS